MSGPTDFTALEAFTRSKIGTARTAKLSTVQMARALKISPEDAVTLYAAYNRNAKRHYEFVVEHTLETNGTHQRLMVRRRLEPDTLPSNHAPLPPPAALQKKMPKRTSRK